MKEITLRTKSRVEMVDITDEVRRAAAESGVRDGICHVFVPHTTAAVTINENADPDVVRDIETHMSGLVPEEGDFRHSEGNSDGHIKSSLFGCSETAFVEGGRLLLGTWQGIYFCEFDGPRSRKVFVKII
ncbi:MAG: secondary thiamine-phosphate synthase enzyme YjbQ [Nitrospirota bacterium]